MDVAGVSIPIGESINITGWLSNSFIWVAIVGIIGFILVIVIAALVFFSTYKRKITIWEDIAGQLVPVLTTRARIIKLRAGGEEVMKTLIGGYYVSAYSKRIGKKSYYFLKGTDGYLYNFVLDRYAKPIFVSGDMRMFNIAIDRLSQQTYGKVSWLERHGVHLLLFVFLIALVGGLWLLIGRIATVTQPLAENIETGKELAETNQKILVSLNNVLRSMGHLPVDLSNTSTTGLVPAG